MELGWAELGWAGPGRTELGWAKGAQQTQGRSRAWSTQGWFTVVGGNAKQNHGADPGLVRFFETVDAV